MSIAAESAGNLAERHPIAVFLLLSFAISWISALLSHPVAGLSDGAADYFGYLAKFGPSLGAIGVFALRGGAEAVSGFLRRLLDWRVKPVWYAIALFGPLSIWCVAAAIRLSSGVLTAEFGFAGFLVFVPLLFKHVFAGGGLGEELGWRGLMLTELQTSRSALSAAVWVGLAWGLWHFPAFLLPASGKSGANPATMILFTLLTIVLSIVFTWVFNSTRGNLLIAVLLHGATNAGENTLKSAIPILKGDATTTFLYAGMLLAIALALIAFAGPRRLSAGPQERGDPT